MPLNESALSWARVGLQAYPPQGHPLNRVPLILKGPPPPLPNIKPEIRRFGFSIRGVSGAYGYDWDYCNQTVAPEP